MSKSEPNVSVSWNGLTFTAHANQGAKFGTGTGASEDDARAAALKDLEKDPYRTPPEVGGSLPVAVDADRAAVARPGRPA